MTQISMIVKQSTVKQNASLKQVYELLKKPDSTYRATIEEIRQLYSSGSATTADELKKTLPGFTASGIFDKRRRTDRLIAYSGMVILDLDDLMPGELQQIKSIVNDMPYTHLSFVSPSGYGLKVIVKVDSNAEAHKQAYEQVKKCYEEETGKKFDKTNDVARLCYVSYDPDAYYNEASQIFKVDVQQQPTAKLISLHHEGADNSITTKDGFDAAVLYTERTIQFSEGSRNNFILQLACNCNRYGIDAQEVLDKCIDRYAEGWNEAEIKSTITGAYNRYGNDFGMWRHILTQEKRSQNSFNRVSEVEDEIDSTLETPTIPLHLIQKMPSVIQEVALMLNRERDRDIYITSMLSVLSGAMPEVFGIYDGDIIYPNLFTFIVGPSASGKGNMKFVRKIAEPCHQKMLNESKAKIKRYYKELEAYNENKRNGKQAGERPIEPPLQMLFVPGNSSSAAIYEHLRDTLGLGIVFETEADTVSSTIKNDWANYSHILRYAFHHESLTSRRKTNKEYIEVPMPKLSIALSGTKDQVTRLIHSAENGLFSRFLFYNFEEEIAWKNVSPANGLYELPQKIKQMGELFAAMVDYLQKEPTEILLSEKQWDTLNQYFGDKLNATVCYFGKETRASVIRLGIIAFRLAMVFTAIKKFEDKNKDVQVYCTDEHFEMAMELVKIYIMHMLAILKSLPSKKKPLDDKLQLFFDELPISFERKDAIAVAKKIGMKAADITIDKYLKRLVNYKFLEKDAMQYNCYRKANQMEDTAAAA